MTMKEPFERAVRRHGPRVLRVCRAVLGPGADADDAWSETFCAALRAWPGLPDDTNIEAWLVTVARRKGIDVIRARAHRPALSCDLPERPSSIGVPGNDQTGVWQAVAELPERQRLALAYHYFGGLPYAETAALIGGSTDAVRRAAADGMKTLRLNYGADDGKKGAPR